MYPKASRPGYPPKKKQPGRQVWGSPKGVSSGETAESIGLCGPLSNTFIGGVTNVWHSALKNQVQMPVALR
jgi:hypothetical protein